MPTLQEIEVTVHPGGKTTIDARGFTGNACLKATSSLEEALGKLSVERKEKPEMHKALTTSTTVKTAR